MEKTIKSESTKYQPVHISDYSNGMAIFIRQGDKKIALSIDQATILGVEILQHAEAMAKKHLGI